MMKCALIRLVSQAEKKCRNRRESVQVLEKYSNSGRMVAVTSASPEAVVMASMLC